MPVGYKLRIWLLRKCKYQIGKDVFIGEDLIIVDDLDDNENRFCLIAGSTTGLYFISAIAASLLLLIMSFIELISNEPHIVLEILLIIFYYMGMGIISDLIPFCLGRFIQFNLAEGKITSFGLYGLKNWNGSLKGKLEWLGEEDIGVLGFTGLKIEFPIHPNQYFIGSAIQVDIEDS